MIQKLFRSFHESRVQYLLISGQASILYGAATFSEDIDLWINPTQRNLNAFIQSLESCHARAYKLTPPLTNRNFVKGHGFHFTLPGLDGGFFLDVMGKPPRVGRYEQAEKRARTIETAWGRLSVVSIEDLVELKKTRRLLDYEVISNLVRISLEEEKSPDPHLVDWALLNTFRAEDIVWILRTFNPSSIPSRKAVKSALEAPRDLDIVRRHIFEDIACLQGKDTAYWTPILKELKRLKSMNQLVPEGMPIAYPKRRTRHS